MGNFFSYEQDETVARTAEEAQASGEPLEAYKLRQQAQEEHKKMAQCFENSQAAYQNKNGALAKTLSEEGKQHKKRVEELNSKAADLTFKANNQKITDPDTIDLHGLRVHEALQKVEERIKLQTKNGRDHLVLIVGMGHHSVDHIKKIEPAVLELIQKLNLSVTPEKPHRGCLYIEIGKGQQKQDNSCIIL